MDDDLKLQHLRNDVYLKLCTVIKHFGWDKFKRHLPSNWCKLVPRDSSNCIQALDSLKKEGVSLKELYLVLYEARLNDAIKLFVDFSPAVITEKLPKEVTVEEGKSLQLECKAVGFPFPKFEWYRCPIGETEMKLLETQTSNVLNIDNFRKKDAGHYGCVAYNNNENLQKFQDKSDSVTVIALTNYHYNDVDSPKRLEPHIVEQPIEPNCFVGIGSSVILKVTAEGEEPLIYEWLKNNKPLEDSNTNRLELLNLMPGTEERMWTYQCMVKNKYGFVLSEPVKIRLAAQCDRTVYQAEDKIALLIGNGNYKCLHPLKSPVEDAATLANLLKKLSFKVIVLCDLDLVEMKNAIKYFCSYLNEGVYGFFYYAGHGFEWHNQRYMLPVNAKNSYSVDDSVCAEYVHAEMEKRKPRLAALLFDMCRTEPDANSKVNEEQVTIYKPAPYPNFVIAYATVFQLKAYELQGQKNGVFASYLKKYIMQKKPFKTIVDNIITDVNADPIAGKFQHPSAYVGLSEAYSLTDRIEPRDEVNARTREYLYNQLINCPNGMVWCWENLPKLEVAMSVYPHKKTIHNGLDIEVRLFSGYPDRTFSARLFLEDKLEDSKEVVQHDGVFSIMDLQKLKENILARFIVVDESNETYEKRIDLGTPLIMCSSLWQNTERAKPVEADSYNE